MDDSHKTRDQLIAEVRALREELAARNRADGYRQETISDNQTEQPLDARAYGLLLESFVTGVFISQADSFVYVSDALQEILGWPLDELIGKQVWDIFASEPGEQSPSGDGGLDRAAQGVRRCQVELVTGYGSKIWAEICTVPILYRGGTARLGSVRDITDDKTVQERVRESEAKYRRLFDLAPIGIISVDPNGTILEVNRKLLEILGSPSVEATKAINMLQFPPLKEAGVSDAFERCLTSGLSINREIPYTSKRGKSSYLRFLLTPVYDDGGRVACCHCVVEDITERRQADEALIESEARYKNLYSMMRLMCDNVPDLIWAKDMEGKYIFVNRAICRKLLNARDTEEPIGKTDMFFAERERAAHPDHREWHTFGEVCLNSDAIVIERKEPGRFDEFGNVSGQFLYLDVYKAPFRDEQGEMIGTVGCGRDVTAEKRLEDERKKTQIALEESERKYRTLFEEALNPIFLVGEDGRYVDANKAALDFLECTLEELKGREVWSFSVPGYVEEDKRRHSPFLARRTLETEYYVNDRFKTLLLNVVPVEISGATFLYGIGQDITARKLAEAALQESEEKYRLVVENTRDGVFVIQDGRCVFANRRAREASEFTPEGLHAQDALELVHPEDRIWAAENHRRRLAGEEHSNAYNLRLLARDGTVYYVEMRTVDILWEGRPAVLAFATDVSDRTRAEQVVLTAERLKAVGELASGVAHNFNNLLQIVLGGSQLALTDLELGNLQQARRNLENIIESARFGARTVKRLQDFARVRKADRAENGAVFDLANTVNESLEMSKPWWKTRPEKEGISVRLKRYVRKGCFIRGNEHEVFEVVVNLIKNAAEALPEGGEIRVRTAVEAAEVVLAVEDNGTGIADEHLGRVFEPFWTTKEFQGTGMGLASSFGIVRRHGGDISVRSRLGQGSIFTVRFPLAHETPQEKGAVHLADTRFRFSILVVDDMPGVAEQLKQALSLAGQTALMATSGHEAVALFAEAPIDAIVCDLAMPGMNGWQVAQAIVETCNEQGRPKPPFVLLTGWGGQIQDQEEMEQYGVDKIVEKPVDVSDLLNIIEELTERGGHR